MLHDNAGNIEKLRCQYDIRKYQDTMMSCMVLFRKK